MSDLKSLAPETKDLMLGEAKVKVRPVTLRQLFRLLALVDKVKADLGLTRKDLEGVELNAKGIGELIQKILTACVGTIDFTADTYELTGTAKLVCSELGSLVGVSAEDLVDAPLDDLYEVVAKFWEVNANGPLGMRVKATIGGLTPMVSLAKDVVMTGFQRELIKALHVGGTGVGGTTGSSSPSFESSDGLSDTSSTSSMPDESSNSTPPSDTTPVSKLPSTELPETLTAPDGPPEVLSLEDKPTSSPSATPSASKP